MYVTYEVQICDFSKFRQKKYKKISKNLLLKFIFAHLYKFFLV